MKSLTVLGVRVEMPTNKPIVLLQEDDGSRYLPIWIGAAEATAIAYAQQGVEPPRPLTHDLFVSTVQALGRALVEVRISDFKDFYYYATLVFDDGTEVDSRASDAIALALRSDARVVTTEQILETAGVTMSDDEGDAAEEADELEKFREFLDNVTPEDFEGLEGEGPHEQTP